MPKKKPDQYTVLLNSTAFKQLLDDVENKIQELDTAVVQLLADDNDEEAKAAAKEAQHWRDCITYMKTKLLNSME